MLTPRQSAILETIQLKRETDDIPPTIQELADHLKIPSTQTVHSDISILRARGYLFPSNGNRSLRLTKKGIRRVLALSKS